MKKFTFILGVVILGIAAFIISKKYTATEVLPTDNVVVESQEGNVWFSSLEEAKKEAKNIQKILLVKVGATW